MKWLVNRNFLNNLYDNAIKLIRHNKEYLENCAWFTKKKEDLLSISSKSLKS